MRIKFSQLAVVFLFSFTSLYSQSKETNQKNVRGQKTGIWHEYYGETSILKSKGKYVDGKKDGEFVYYNKKNPQYIIAKRFYKPNSKESLAFYFDKKNDTIAKGYYYKDLKNGEWEFYNDNKLIYKETYLNNKKHGSVKLYDKNTEVLILEETYIEGKKNGPYVKYNSEGKKINSGNYKDGKLDGEIYFYETNTGRISIKGYYKMGIKSGEWNYYSNGQIVNSERF